MAETESFLAPTYKRADLHLQRGQGVFLYDREGREYLDMAAGIAVNALGYGHPAIEEELARGGLIHTSNLYHTAPGEALARQLCKGCFADKVFFCNSGAEANEGAIKFARKAGGSRRAIVSFSDGFHGRTMGALAATANPRYREPFEPLIGAVRFATFNDLSSLDGVLDDQVAAVLVEPIQGEGGVRPATREFLQGLRQRCNQVGALLILDEVQCGLGRTGRLWAHQHYDLEPDIMTVAKPLGGGLPIGAILMNQRVADTIEFGDHGSTFGGGLLVTRVAGRILEVIDNPEFLRHVQGVGQQLETILQGVDSPWVIRAQGQGLMWGLVLDPQLPVAQWVEAGYRHGLIMLSSGGNTLRLLPPLIIEPEHLRLFEHRLHASLAAVRP